MSRMMDDIAGEPEQLARSLAYAFGEGAPALQAAADALIEAGQIVIAGIGASWHAGMAMQAMLLRRGRAAVLVDASELMTIDRLPEDLALVLLSRSGRSIEIVRLAERFAAAGVRVIAITNTPESPLARVAGYVVQTATTFDHAVSVTTYSAIALQGGLLAWAATGGEMTACRRALEEAISRISELVPQWAAALESSGWLSAEGPPTYFLARGSSVASCNEARLLWEEAAKLPATALTTGGFRHGPQEIVRAGLRVAVWIDGEAMRTQDLTLAADLRAFGVKVLLIGQELDDAAADCVLHLPAVPAEWQFVLDVVPIQIAAERQSALRGEDCDTFRLCSYIVEDEGGLTRAAGAS